MSFWCLSEICEIDADNFLFEHLQRKMLAIQCKLCKEKDKYPMTRWQLQSSVLVAWWLVCYSDPWTYTSRVPAPSRTPIWSCQRINIDQLFLLVKIDSYWVNTPTKQSYQNIHNSKLKISARRRPSLRVTYDISSPDLEATKEDTVRK